MVFRPEREDIVPAGRRDLQRPFDVLLSADVEDIRDRQRGAQLASQGVPGG